MCKSNVALCSCYFVLLIVAKFGKYVNAYYHCMKFKRVFPDLF